MRSMRSMLWDLFYVIGDLLRVLLCMHMCMHTMIFLQKLSKKGKKAQNYLWVARNKTVTAQHENQYRDVPITPQSRGTAAAEPSACDPQTLAY
jgi:hypothetical protein